jgi:AcrR family transcriptional regulator
VLRPIQDAARTRTRDVRAALIDAAVAVIERDGPAGLTVRGVAAEAGVAPVGIYNHLDDKRGLQLAVVNAGFRDLHAALAGATAADPRARLYECGHAYRRFAQFHPQVYRMMFGTNLLGCELTSPGRPFKALVEVVMYAQVGGAVHGGDPTTIAKHLWAAIHGAVIFELERIDPTGRPTDWDAEYEELLKLIMRGLTA